MQPPPVIANTQTVANTSTVPTSVRFNLASPFFSSHRIFPTVQASLPFLGASPTEKMALSKRPYFLFSILLVAFFSIVTVLKLYIHLQRLHVVTDVKEAVVENRVNAKQTLPNRTEILTTLSDFSVVYNKQPITGSTFVVSPLRE